MALQCEDGNSPSIRTCGACAWEKSKSRAGSADRKWLGAGTDQAEACRRASSKFFEGLQRPQAGEGRSSAAGNSTV